MRKIKIVTISQSLPLALEAIVTSSSQDFLPYMARHSVCYVNGEMKYNISRSRKHKK